MYCSETDSQAQARNQGEGERGGDPYKNTCSRRIENYYFLNDAPQNIYTWKLSQPSDLCLAVQVQVTTLVHCHRNYFLTSKEVEILQ